MNKSPFALFGTDKDLEKKGLVVNYGSFRVTLARAGGSNQEFNLRRNQLAKPYIRLIQQGTMDAEQMEELDRQLFTETVIRNFEVADEKGKWKPGVPARDGSVQEYSDENVINLLRELPDLFADIRRVSSDHANYLEAAEEIKGN